MKRQFLFVLLSLFALTSLYSQVAINDNGAEADESAILDISSENKGLLLPRMQITDVDSDISPVNFPAQGLLIYNTGSPEVPEGYYVWSGDEWEQLINSNSDLSIDQTAVVYESAELYESNDISSPTTITMTNTGSYYSWMNASEGTLFGNMTTNPGHADGSRIIIGEAGLYHIIVASSFGGSNNNVITGAIFVTPEGGTEEISRIKFISKISNSGDVVSACTHGVLALNANDAIDIRFSANWNDENIDIFILNLTATKSGN